MKVRVQILREVLVQVPAEILLLLSEMCFQTFIFDLYSWFIFDFYGLTQVIIIWHSCISDVIIGFR